MKITKEQLLEAALALNGNDKKYTVSVEDDKIITKVKWMDATFFAPGSVTDEMREFEYIVKVGNNGKYTEIDKSVSTSKSARGGIFNYNKKMFYGKQITFDKTIGLGKDKQTGEAGVIDTTFYSEDYKEPVRSLLKQSGYKKKMGPLGKIFIGAGIFAVIILIAVILLLNSIPDKEAISSKEFETMAESKGYVTAVDEESAKDVDYIEEIMIAYDEQDDYQIEFWTFDNSESARGVFETNKDEFEKIASKDSNASYSSVSSSDYSKYSATTSSHYLYLVAVDNTMVFVDVDIKYKDEVQKLIEEMDY